MLLLKVVVCINLLFFVLNTFAYYSGSLFYVVVDRTFTRTCVNLTGFA